MKPRLLFLLLFIGHISFGQTYSGKVLNIKSNLPVEFVNICIPGKDFGTVSNKNGKFSISMDSLNFEDTLLFSCIGYQPLAIKVKTYKDSPDRLVYLTENIIESGEVIKKPKFYKKKVLGITTQSKFSEFGIEKVKLGSEYGILMNVKKIAELEKVHLNIASCTYDSVFYRLNVYKETEHKKFENILKRPIYIKFLKEHASDQMSFDLKDEHIVVSGNFLVTLEHVQDWGKGELNFCCSLFEKTYFRKTCHGPWETSTCGISISVEANVER